MKYHLKPRYQENDFEKLLQKRICPNCGIDNPKTANFCKFCEYKLD